MSIEQLSGKFMSGPTRPSTLQAAGANGSHDARRVAYLVGVCGSGMKALAEVLIGRGWRVLGSDLQADSPAGETLRSRGVRVFSDHSAAHIPDECELLVYSSAVKADNPERVWAREREAARVQRSGGAADERPFDSFAYHEMLGALMCASVGISIAGTHGKSTTTALTGSILTDAGLQPTVLVGAEVCGRGANGWSGAGAHCVVESCEYQRHFLSLHPKLATILGIEEDHFDCFKDVAETIAAFRDFAQRLPSDGLLVIPADSENCRRACEGILARVERIAVSSSQNDLQRTNGSTGASPSHSAVGADWWAAHVEKISLGHRFEILFRGEHFCSTSLRIPGRHHVLNALAAAALCYRAGASAEQIGKGIEAFRGIRRRFEVLDDWLGATVVDDYAHHPTAIQATLRTAREEFGERRLVCVFQPHQVSRTLGLLPEFATSFSHADQVLIVPVYGARETYQQELTDVSRRLAEMIAAQGVAACFSGSLDQTRASLEDTLRPGDVLLTLGAGDIDRIHHALTRRLP